MSITHSDYGSPSAIFRAARARPEMAHAIRTAPRSWWKKATETHGDMYFAVWFHRDPIEDDAPAPGWVVVGKRWSYKQQAYISRAISEGFTARWVLLARQHLVLNATGHEHGLVCRLCGLITHTFLPEQPFICGRCESRAERAGGMERYLAKKIMRDAYKAKKPVNPP